MIMAAMTTAVTISIIKSQTPKGSLKPQIPVSGCFFQAAPHTRKAA